MGGEWGEHSRRRVGVSIKGREGRKPLISFAARHAPDRVIRSSENWQSENDRSPSGAKEKIAADLAEMGRFFFVLSGLAFFSFPARFRICFDIRILPEIADSLTLTLSDGKI